MAITAEQREARKAYVGSSDMGAILGLDPFRSAADIWLEKTGRAEPFAGNEHTERGALLEPVILDWAKGEIGRAFDRDVMRVHPAGVLAANFDGIGLDGDFVVEAKSSVNPEEWGEAGTDQVPERVMVQTHHQMHVAGPACRVAWVPVLLPGYRSFDFRLYRVERDDELAAAVAAKGMEFWERHVVPRVEPVGSLASVEVLRRVRREPAKVVTVADPIADAWITCRAARLQAEKEEARAERALLAALGDAEAADHSGGRITYFVTTRKGYTVGPSAYRQLRLKKAAKEAL